VLWLEFSTKLLQAQTPSSASTVCSSFHQALLSPRVCEGVHRFITDDSCMTSFTRVETMSLMSVLNVACVCR